MASPPSTATLTGSVTWDNGTPFDGYLHLGLVLPGYGSSQWPSTTLAGLAPPQRLPIWTVVPIVNGAFDQQTKVFYNSSLEPPNTQYVAYWYDLSHNAVHLTSVTLFAKLIRRVRPR